MARLTDSDITARLATLDGWTRDGAAIRKAYALDGFPEAVLFVSALVPDAEEADHHPDITIRGRQVVLAYTTHDAGGLTEKDFEQAAAADRVAGELKHLTEFSEG